MTSERNKALKSLRGWMAEQNLEAVIIPRVDAFQGEEVPASEDRLHFISGFTGSAGHAVITATQATLFSDSRYTLQMAAEVEIGWTTHTEPEESVSGWLKQNLKTGRVGIDGHLITLSDWRRIVQSLPDSLKMVALTENPIDAIWPNRPAPPTAPAWPYPDAYAGQNRIDKIKDTRAEMTVDSLLITSPDALCWLLNIRGQELEFTPFYRAFGILSGAGEVTVFTKAERLNAISHENVIVRPEDSLLSELAALHDGKISIDPATCPYILAAMLGEKAIEEQSPITSLKARKNKTEIAGIRAAHCRDAVAMIRFLAWLDGASGLRESDVSKKLHALRSEEEGFISPSFGTICGSGANGAIIHYRAVAGKDSEIQSNTLCLIDSGGQYMDGTTDITRTVAIGQPSAQMRVDFTQVLKAHIALDKAVFPSGTNGIQLDALARAPLWEAGMDFAHGTGHGVGCCLGVHEGPANISRHGTASIEEGMVLSNEPGHYIEGAYGIRIENLMIAQPHPQYDGYLCLKHVTLVPIDKRLIDSDLLTAQEQQWVNDYHAEIHNRLNMDIISLEDADILRWFEKATRPIESS